MCFSAPVSFVASGILGVAGGAAVRRARRRLLPLAVVPIIFGIQQLLEGIVWISVPGSTVGMGAAYGFLFIALLFWPWYAPLVAHRIERNKQRKKLMKVFCIMGGLVSVFLLFMLFLRPLTVTMESGSVFYDLRMSVFTYTVIGILYILAACGAWLSSSDAWMRNFGRAILVSAVFSWIFFELTFVSAWCFFAAGLSIFIFFYVRKQTKK